MFDVVKAVREAAERMEAVGNGPSKEAVDRVAESGLIADRSSLVARVFIAWLGSHPEAMAALNWSAAAQQIADSREEVGSQAWFDRPDPLPGGEDPVAFVASGKCYAFVTRSGWEPCGIQEQVAATLVRLLHYRTGVSVVIPYRCVHPLCRDLVRKKSSSLPGAGQEVFFEDAPEPNQEGQGMILEEAD